MVIELKKKLLLMVVCTCICSCLFGCGVKEGSNPGTYLNNYKIDNGIPLDK